MTDTNDARAVGPFTENDRLRGEAIVRALYDIKGHYALVKYIAQQLAAERRAAAPSEEEVAGTIEAVLKRYFAGNSNEAARAVIALYRRPFPEGWQVAPKEPTEEMLCEARDWSVKKYGIGVGNDGATGCYRAMLAAAPHPPKRET